LPDSNNSAGEPTRAQKDKVLFGLLMAALLVSAVALLREGPYLDNVIDGGRLFLFAFFAGMLAGFIGWTRATGVAPVLGFSGADRHPWIAALVLGLAFTAAGSRINRAFTSPTGHTMTAAVFSIDEGRIDRWHVTAKLPDGTSKRYVIAKDTADALKGAKDVRMSIARGIFGFDFVEKFEPVRH
jgi:hypothetical protein